MMAKRHLGWRKLFLILTVLPCCRSLQVSIPEVEYEVAKGADITLTCSFIPARPVSNALVLTWAADPDNVDDPMQPVATYFINNPVDIAPAYEGMATLEVDITNQVSRLHLTKVTMQESRRFQCSVMIPNDDEGTTAATTYLLVLEPPSVPICGIQGKAEYFQNISVTCMSKEGSPKPVYEWKTYSVENVQRAFPPKTTEKDGVLSLFNISRETSGFYVCTASNRIGSASCNLTLAVMPGSMSIGSTGAIIGGILAGVVVLGIVIFCCCRKKGKKDKYAEGSPGEAAFYDRDAPEAGESYWDDKSNPKTRQHEEEDIVHQNNSSVGTAEHKFEDDQHSYNSGKVRNDDKGSDIESKRYQDNQYDHKRGSRDRLDDECERYGGSRERLDDDRGRYGGSRDRLDDRRDGYSGSRDRLDDRRDGYSGSRDGYSGSRDGYSGSRDRLDDRRDGYSGSRDRLDDRRDGYSGSRDRLDDRRDGYSGSSDRLDDRRDGYSGSRDRLDDRRDGYSGSRDRLDDRRDGYSGSRDRLDDRRDGYSGSRDRLDDRRDGYSGSSDRLDDRRDGYSGSSDRLDDHRGRYGGSRDRLDDRRDRYGGSRDHVEYTDDKYRNQYD